MTNVQKQEEWDGMGLLLFIVLSAVCGWLWLNQGLLGIEIVIPFSIT